MNPSVFGQDVLVYATVSAVSPATGTPSGWVDFYDNGVFLGSGGLDGGGNTSFDVSSLAVGGHVIEGDYSGDGSFDSASSTLSQTVSQADTTTSLTSAANPSTYGQDVAFTATVAPSGYGAGTPTGTVTFTIAGTSIADTETLSGGAASFDASGLPAGDLDVTATYSGDADFNGSSQSMDQGVNQADSTTALASSANPSVFGQTVTFTATVGSDVGTPTGTVTFSIPSASISDTETLSGGTATYVTSDLPLGAARQVQAIYNGDANFNFSTDTINQTVNLDDVTVTVTSAVNPSAFGQGMTFTATVAPDAPGSGIPDGSVTFTMDGETQTIALDTSGSATFTPLSVPVPGTYVVSAAYSGDGDFNAGSGSMSQTVNKANTVTRLISARNPSTFGESETFTATVQAQAARAGVPSGSVTFTIGTENHMVPLDGDGQAVFSAGNLAAGTYTIDATYNGNQNLNTSTASFEQTVNSANTTGSGTLAVLDPATDQILPSNGTPINTYSAWDMSLEAQVSGTSVASYSWDLSNAPDVTNVTGDGTYNLQFTWASFTGTVNTDVIEVTETSADGGHITSTYNFQVTGTDNAGWTAAPPTSAATWPHVIAPDLLNGQATQAVGPYAQIGLVDGSVQTSHAMPSYNPNVEPFSLVYNSAAADPQPVFLVRYQLDPNQSLPANVTAQLTLTDQDGDTVFAGPTVYFDTSTLNPGDWMQMALPVDPTVLATGRYNWQVVVGAGESNVTYTGGYDFVTGSTGADSLTATPFGPGWSPGDLYRLYPVEGGVILQNPDGTSLWFAQNDDGSYASPAGDFSTLTFDSETGIYTRTLTDGTQYNFNTSGQQISVVDRNGNTTSYAWNDAAELTSITDMNGQVVTLTYNTSGFLTSAVDPASRTLALGFNSSNQLTTLTDPDGTVWNYTYTAAGELTSVGDPTQFTYTPDGRVTTIALPTGASESLTPGQSQGLSGEGLGSETDPAAPVALAGSGAEFQDPAGDTTQTYTDGLGMGLPQQVMTPGGKVSLTDHDANGLPWLTATPKGSPTHETFDNKGNTCCVVCASIYGDDG